MSGGSYNYLCYKDLSGLLDGSSDKDLQSMADRLAGLGYANDAALETQNLLLVLRQSRYRIKASLNRLTRLWRSIEWWDSCDSGEDTVKNELTKYREG